MEERACEGNPMSSPICSGERNDAPSASLLSSRCKSCELELTGSELSSRREAVDRQGRHERRRPGPGRAFGRVSSSFLGTCSSELTGRSDSRPEDMTTRSGSGRHGRASASRASTTLRASAFGSFKVPPAGAELDPEQQINRLAISPDKRLLAVAGNAHVRLYDVAIATSHAPPPPAHGGHGGHGSGAGGGEKERSAQAQAQAQAQAGLVRRPSLIEPRFSLTPARRKRWPALCIRQM